LAVFPARFQWVNHTRTLLDHFHCNTRRPTCTKKRFKYSTHYFHAHDHLLLLFIFFMAYLRHWVWANYLPFFSNTQLSHSICQSYRIPHPPTLCTHHTHNITPSQQNFTNCCIKWRNISRARIVTRKLKKKIANCSDNKPLILIRDRKNYLDYSG
jgi:hypothetical protein